MTRETNENIMSKNFIKEQKSTYTEVIDGVTVVHTGQQRSGRDVLIMYDAEGNRFYSNFGSIEKAKLAILKLAENGITAIIGPKAPWIDSKTGNPINNPSKNEVGVFIVSEPEKSDDFSSRKIR